MKKILFAALTAIFIVSGAFARDEKKISYKVLHAFAGEFDEATEVNWTSGAEFNEACFNLDGKQVSAFYTLAGEKIGTTQAISFESLPAKAKKCIAKKYGDYAIKETLLFESDQETAYFVSAENSVRSVVLKVAYGHVSVFKKKNKG